MVTALLGEIVNRVGERWAARAALPGLAFLAVAAVAGTAGHAGALDFTALRARVDSVAAGADGLSTGSALLLLAAVVGSAMAAAWCAGAIGRGLERHWFARRRRFLWRRREEQAPSEAAWHSSGRATPLSGMFEQACERLRKGRGIELATIWPVLWLSLPETSRNEIALARAGLRDGADRIGWGLMYAVLGALWWPGLLIGVVLLWHGRVRSRTGMSDYLRVINAAVLLHVPELAVSLGLVSDSPPRADDYRRLTLYLQDGPEFEFAVLDPEP